MPDTRLIIKLTRRQRDEIVEILDQEGNTALDLSCQSDEMEKYAGRCFQLAGLLLRPSSSAKQSPDPTRNP